MTDETRQSPTDTVSHELSGKTMPIMLPSSWELRIRRGERFVFVKEIPWEMIADTVGERQSQRNHSQSLDRIRERGGFSAGEAIAVISGQAWQRLPSDEYAHRLLYSMRVLFARGRLYGRSVEQLAGSQRPNSLPERSDA